MMVHVSDSNLKDSSLRNRTIFDQSPRASPHSRSEFCTRRCSSWYQDTKAKLEGDVARLKVRQKKMHLKNGVFFEFSEFHGMWKVMISQLLIDVDLVGGVQF